MSAKAWLGLVVAAMAALPLRAADSPTISVPPFQVQTHAWAEGDLPRILAWHGQFASELLARHDCNLVARDRGVDTSRERSIAGLNCDEMPELPSLELAGADWIVRGELRDRAAQSALPVTGLVECIDLSAPDRSVVRGIEARTMQEAVEQLAAAAAEAMDLAPRARPPDGAWRDRDMGWAVLPFGRIQDTAELATLETEAEALLQKAGYGRLVDRAKVDAVIQERCIVALNGADARLLASLTGARRLLNAQLSHQRDGWRLDLQLLDGLSGLAFDAVSRKGLKTAEVPAALADALQSLCKGDAQPVVSPMTAEGKAREIEHYRRMQHYGTKKHYDGWGERMLDAVTKLQAAEALFLLNPEDAQLRQLAWDSTVLILVDRLSHYAGFTTRTPMMNKRAGALLESLRHRLEGREEPERIALLRATAALTRDDYADALGGLRATTWSNPTNRRYALAIEAFALEKTGHPEEAIEVVDRALKLPVTRFLMLTQLGYIRADAERARSARNPSSMIEAYHRERALFESDRHLFYRKENLDDFFMHMRKAESPAYCLEWPAINMTNQGGRIAESILLHEAAVYQGLGQTNEAVERARLMHRIAQADANSERGNMHALNLLKKMGEPIPRMPETFHPPAGIRDWPTNLPVYLLPLEGCDPRPLHAMAQTLRSTLGAPVRMLPPMTPPDDEPAWKTWSALRAALARGLPVPRDAGALVVVSDRSPSRNAFYDFSRYDRFVPFVTAYGTTFYQGDDLSARKVGRSMGLQAVHHWLTYAEKHAYEKPRPTFPCLAANRYSMVRFTSYDLDALCPSVASFYRNLDIDEVALGARSLMVEQGARPSPALAGREAPDVVVNGPVLAAGPVRCGLRRPEALTVLPLEQGGATNRLFSIYNAAWPGEHACVAEDGTNLYFSYIAGTTDRPPVVRPDVEDAMTQGEQLENSPEDTFMLFFTDTHGAATVKFMVGASGYRADGKGPSLFRLVPVDPKWNGVWTATVTRTEGGWTAGITIPKATLKEAGLDTDALLVNAAARRFIGDRPFETYLTDPGLLGFSRCANALPLRAPEAAPPPRRWDLRLVFAPSAPPPANATARVVIDGKLVADALPLPARTTAAHEIFTCMLSDVSLPDAPVVDVESIGEQPLPPLSALEFSQRR